MSLAAIRCFQFWKQIDIVFRFTKMYRELNMYRKGANKLCDEITSEVEREYQTGVKSADRTPQNLIDNLYKIRDTMTYEDVRNEINTFIVAGYDTSAKVKFNMNVCKAYYYHLGNS